jgi:hypothetical protein
LESAALKSEALKSDHLKPEHLSQTTATISAYPAKNDKILIN